MTGGDPKQRAGGQKSDPGVEDEINAGLSLGGPGQGQPATRALAEGENVVERTQLVSYLGSPSGEGNET